MSESSPLPLTPATQKYLLGWSTQNLKSPHCSNIWFSHWKLLLKSKCYIGILKQTLEIKDYIKKERIWGNCLCYNAQFQKKECKINTQSWSDAVLRCYEVRASIYDPAHEYKPIGKRNPAPSGNFCYYLFQMSAFHSFWSSDPTLFTVYLISPFAELRRLTLTSC